MVIWLTGLSGSGKSTLAEGLEKNLYDKGFLTVTLDGDNIREGLNINLGFSDKDRKENIRRIAEVAKLFLKCGIICINCFVSPTEKMRRMAATIIGADDFVLVYVDTPLEICEKRDIKGLYAKARKGKLKDFTGIDAPFEPPANPDLVLHAGEQSYKVCLRQLEKFVLDKIASVRGVNRAD